MARKKMTNKDKNKKQIYFCNSNLKLQYCEKAEKSNPKDGENDQKNRKFCDNL